MAPKKTHKGSNAPRQSTLANSAVQVQTSMIQPAYKRKKPTGNRNADAECRSSQRQRTIVGGIATSRGVVAPPTHAARSSRSTVEQQEPDDDDDDSPESNADSGSGEEEEEEEGSIQPSYTMCTALKPV